MTRPVAVLIAIGIIVGAAALGLVKLGVLPAIIFTIASVGGFVLWLATTYRTPIDPHKVIVPYLLAVILGIIHVYEEYLTDFEGLVSDISGFHVLERDFLTVAAHPGGIWSLHHVVRDPESRSSLSRQTGLTLGPRPGGAR